MSIYKKLQKQRMRVNMAIKGLHIDEIKSIGFKSKPLLKKFIKDNDLIFDAVHYKNLNDYFEFIQKERRQYLKDIKDTKQQHEENEHDQYDGSYLFFQELVAGVEAIKGAKQITYNGRLFQQRLVLDSVTTTNPEIQQFKNNKYVLRKNTNGFKKLTKISTSDDIESNLKHFISQYVDLIVNKGIHKSKATYESDFDLTNEFANDNSKNDIIILSKHIEYEKVDDATNLNELFGFNI